MRYSQLPRELVGAGNMLRGILPGNRGKALMQAVQAYRFARSARIRKPALRRIRRAVGSSLWRDQRVGWSRYDEATIGAPLSRSVVLKEPAEDGEKGVLLMTFEYNWLRLLSAVPELAELESELAGDAESQKA